MKRNGYTIAEALVTMLIVGVVAALTLPVFVVSYRKQVYAASLSSAVVNFESAMTAMMIKEGTNDLLDTRAWKSIETAGVYTLNDTTADANIKKFMRYIGKNLPLNKYEKGAEFVYKKLDLGDDTSSIENAVLFRTQKGVDYILQISDVKYSNAKAEAANLIAGSSYTNHAAEVYIDVNGVSGPNIEGRDLFRYGLATDGHLYPFGSKSYATYNSLTYTSPKTKCVTDKDGEYCAAYLAGNSYKMDY